MNAIQNHVESVCRRHFFGQFGLGLGTAALAFVLPEVAFGADGAQANAQRIGGLDSLPHFEPTAKRAIYLFMAGAPSQIDMLDYKPKLNEFFQKDLRKMPEVQMGQRITTMTSGQGALPIAPSKYKFEQCGNSGAWVSELLPHHKKIVDDIAIVRSLHTEAINHDPAITYICTGHQLPGRASLGSWLSYGLGTMNADLPAFVVMTPTWTGRKQAQALYNRLWSAGFLPSEYSAVSLRRDGDPVLFLKDPPGVSRKLRERMVQSLEKMNEETLARIGDPATQARIDAARMAFNMQRSVPELVDISDEPKNILDMYGPDCPQAGHLRPQLPARTTNDGAGRTVRANLPSRVGSTRKYRRRFAKSVPRHRPALPGASSRFETARTAGRHTRRLGRRVRTHGLLSGQADQGQLRPRPSPKELYHLDGGRRHQAGCRPRRDRRFQLQRGERPRSHSRPERHHLALPGH